MTELWRVFNIVNRELLLPVEIKMLPNNLFHKIFIRGMFTVHPIIPSVSGQARPPSSTFVVGWGAARDRPTRFPFAESVCSLLLGPLLRFFGSLAIHRTWPSFHPHGPSIRGRLLCANKGWKLLLCYWHREAAKRKRILGEKKSGKCLQKFPCRNTSRGGVVFVHLQLLLQTTRRCSSSFRSPSSAKLSWRGRWCN